MNKVKKIAALFCIIMSAICLPNHTASKKYAIYQDLHKLTGYDDIVTYSYYIKRLSESTYFLSRLCKHNYYYKPCNVITQEDFVQIESVLFLHHRTKACLQSMIQTKSLQPILLLLQDTRHYYYLQDSSFMYELFLLIFTIHKQIIFNECEENPHVLKHITLDTILEISERINQLPIAEVLNAIDMLVKELPPFLEKYEFHSTITWKAWFKKYWWVPPVFGAWFGLRILLSLQRPQFYYSSYLSPKPQIPLQPIITNDPALLEIRRNRKRLNVLLKFNINTLIFNKNMVSSSSS